MLEPNGRHVLQIMGKDAGPKGIIQPAEMAGAISALESAIASEEAEQKAAEGEGKAEPAHKGDSVSLRQRAAPMLDMLKRCEKAGADIVWGV